MAERWHIGKDGEPHPCTAAAGNCPLGGANGLENHYATEAEARAAIEKSIEREEKYRKAYRRKALMNRAPIPIREDLEAYKYVDQVDYDEARKPLVDYILDHRDSIQEAKADGRIAEIDGETFKIQGMRISKEARGVLHAAENDRVLGGMRALFDRKDVPKGIPMAIGYKTVENMDADLNALKEELRNRASTGLTGSHATQANVFYTFDVHAGDGRAFRHRPETYWDSHHTTQGKIRMRDKTGMYMEPYMDVDEEALARDLEAAGYDIEELTTGTDSLQMAKVRAFVARTADEELGLKPRSRGIREKREEFIEQSGLFEKKTEFTPDPDSVNRLIADAEGMGVPARGRKYTPEAVKGMTNPQLRIALVETATYRQEFVDEVNDMQSKVKEKYENPAAQIAASTGKDANVAIGGMTFRSRTITSLVDDRAKVESFITSHGGVVDDFKSPVKHVTVDSLKRFHADHPEVSVYKYGIPRQRVFYRDMERKDEGRGGINRIMTYMDKADGTHEIIV